MKWFIYLLRCVDTSLYTGVTNNIEKRVQKHQAGVGGKYTRSHLPVELVYSETFLTKSEALKREIAIKKLTKQQKERLVSNNSSI